MLMLPEQMLSLLTHCSQKLQEKTRWPPQKFSLKLYRKLLNMTRIILKILEVKSGSLQNAIRNNPASGNTPAGTANTAQQQALNGLLATQQRQLTNVNNQEAVIDQLKLVK